MLVHFCHLIFQLWVVCCTCYLKPWSINYLDSILTSFSRCILLTFLQLQKLDRAKSWNMSTILILQWKEIENIVRSRNRKIIWTTHRFIGCRDWVRSLWWTFTHSLALRTQGIVHNNYYTPGASNLYAFYI